MNPSAKTLRAVAWVTAFLLSLWVIDLVAHCETAPWILGNDYAAEYKTWAMMRNARVESPTAAGTLSAAEYLEWQKVKHKWRVLERSIDREYRGEN